MARFCELTTPVGEALRFARMTVTERLSELFEIELEAVGDKGDVDPKDILGKSLSVKITWEDGVSREYSGYAVRFAFGRKEHETWRYRISLRPWVWFLTRTNDCRIFQAVDTQEIIKTVLDEEPTAVVDDRLNGSYSPHEYCVQYRESDFDFVSRLMEREGMYYFFEHADGRHSLVLMDSKASHKPIEGAGTVSYVADAARRLHQRDHVAVWDAVESVASGVFTLDEYDFKRPGTDMQVTRKPDVAATHSKIDYEVFDYPGDYDNHDEGETHVAARIEELQAVREVHEGSGPLRQFHVGRTVKLDGLSNPGHNGEYLITGTEHTFEEEQYASGGGTAADFSCRFTAIRARQQFRPLRRTRRPVVHGIQTAVVSGPAGDEIHTDDFGRIKVQFHWDRYGKSDDQSSCWMRVAFLAAGPRFGFVSIPRIGHEVVVDFLEGDPDRPLVTGVVYNGANMPPWALPANKTQSGLYTRSSKGGGYDNANAIRFEDKKGAEQVWIHAEKNQDIEVENDETHWVGHDRTKTIDHDETTHVKHDRTETVGNNETITIGVNRTENVGVDESVTIGSNRTHTIGANETQTVALQRTRAVGVNETVAIGAAQEIAVGAMRSLAIGINQSHNIGANRSADIGANDSVTVGSDRTVKIGSAHSVDVGAAQTIKVGADQSVSVTGGDTTSIGKDAALSVTGGRTTSIGKDDALKVAKNLVIDAGDSVTIKTGSASIAMKKDGTIAIKGKDITVDASGKLTTKSSGETKMTGSKILQN